VKLVFLGTPGPAVPSLQALIGAGHEVALVVTQPDRPAGRSRRLVPPPVKLAALEHGLPIFQPLKVRNKAFRSRLASCSPDLLVVVAYGRILSGAVLRLAPGGAVTVHFSLLPAYRGAAPVQWALALGETVTGVTTMQLNEKMDEGDILLQQELPIAAGEHSPALQTRLADVGAGLLLETLAQIDGGVAAPRPQDHSAASLAPMLTRADGRPGPDLPAPQLLGRVRGFDPWPGVWFERRGKRVRVIDAVLLDAEESDQLPGRLAEFTAEGLVMCCGAGTRLLLTRVQPAGGKVLSARDAVNGRHLQVGDRLGTVRERD